ncbi:hypothetical protein ACS0TY_000282 [Phlomoides rotata]
METLWLWLYLYLYVLISFMQCPTVFSLINNNTSVNHLCREYESQLLLQLKQQLFPLYPDAYYKTKYWKGSRDCCEWDGVTCDYFTGHVIALDLRLSPLIGNLKSNSSLFHLNHLRKLNLADIDFSGSTLASEFGRLNALTHLDLSFTNFGGEIPMEFYHLSNLLSLDLSNLFSSGPQIGCDVKMLFGNMTRLRVLLLRNQHVSNSELPINTSSFLTNLDLGFTGLRGELPATLFEKPNLQILRLNNNSDLEGSLPKSLNRSNVNSIQGLDLSGTSISGTLPHSIGLMTNLNYINLSGCRFSGPIPESIGNITPLSYLFLRGNHLNGQLPDAVGGLPHLAHLDLSYNSIVGQLPDAVGGLPRLAHLDLSFNSFVGQIPSSLTNMSRLEYLDISSNAFTGPLPSAAGHGLQKLLYMDLSNNSIQGMIPSWLFSLPSLWKLALSSNRLTGRIGRLNSNTLAYLDLRSNVLNIKLEFVYNLSSIEHLLISHNTVTEHDGDIVNVTFPYLETLEMSSCQIKEFPNFLRSNILNLFSLDLSNNSIHGPIPSWFTSNLSETLSYLDLSANFFTSYPGYLYWKDLWFLDLHSNSLRGTFPPFICNMSLLSILNLSHNKLSGNIPECLPNSTNIEVLDLRRNEFHGKIPTTIGAISYLANLGLNGNHLQGPLPPSLGNCTHLEVLDLGNNIIQDTFPWWLHTLHQLKILILKSNSFHGSITPPISNNSLTNLQILDLSYNNFTGLLPEKLFASLEAIKNLSQASPDEGLYMGSGQYEYSVTVSVKGKYVEFTRVLKIFTTIDLSSNNFIGSIPDSLSNLTSLRLLNLSHNSIHGSIPPALGRMTNLEQLDLSSNQLSRGIPQTLTSLTFLVALNLSHNYLIGPIPQANQFLTFSNESYAGNSGLCGAPLTRSCGDEREPPSAGDFEEDEDDGFMMGFTWKAVVMGYGCGILLGFILGNVMISIQKPTWLARFVYVEAAIILNKRNKRRRLVQGRS